MKTATAALSAITLTAAAQQEANATQVDLDAITVTNHQVMISAKLTSPANAPGPGRKVFLYYAFATDSVSSNIPITLAPTATKVEMLAAQEANGIRIYNFPATMTGRYLYIWQSHEAMPTSLTLTASVIS